MIVRPNYWRASNRTAGIEDCTQGVVSRSTCEGGREQGGGGLWVDKAEQVDGQGFWLFPGLHLIGCATARGRMSATFSRAGWAASGARGWMPAPLSRAMFSSHCRGESAPNIAAVAATYSDLPR